MSCWYLCGIGSVTSSGIVEVIIIPSKGSFVIGWIAELPPSLLLRSTGAALSCASRLVYLLIVDFGYVGLV